MHASVAQLLAGVNAGTAAAVGGLLP
jgi:hypothetical protein